MIICRECGLRNVDTDAFCGSCGSFLEFTGEKAGPAVSGEFRQQVEQEAAEPPERTPQATRKLAAAVTKTKPTRRLRAGDLICGQCGEGNVLTRRFCSRCGASLLEAERVGTPWWRRLARLFQRGPRVVELPADDVTAKAGASGTRGGSAVHDAQLRKTLAGRDPRYQLRKMYRRARLVLACVIMLGGIAYGSYGPFRALIDGRVESTKSRITRAIDIHLVPVHAVTVSANLQEKGNPGFDAVDGFLNTYWLAPYSEADYPTLTLTFGQAVTLERMIIYSGVSENYLAHGRPSLLVLVFSNDKSATLTPQDTPKEQILNISNAVQITSLKIEVEGIYPGTGRPSDVAISDIELFRLE